MMSALADPVIVVQFCGARHVASTALARAPLSCITRRLRQKTILDEQRNKDPSQQWPKRLFAPRPTCDGVARL